MSRPANPTTRATLIEAAREEFTHKGLAESRIEEITRRAGTSKGAFYLHFESKEELWDLIAREFLDGVLAMLASYEGIVCHEPGPHTLRLALEADTAFSQYLWDNRAALRMVLEGGNGTPHARLADEFVAAIDAYMTATVTRHQAMQAHFNADMDPDVVAMFFTGAIHIFARRILRAETPPDFRHVAVQLRKIMCGGLFLPEIGAAFSSALNDLASVHPEAP